MGTTTSTALRAGSGVFGFTLLIEGYDKIITDAADLTAVVTAYAAESWSAAIGGLTVIGGVKQSIEPVKNDFDIPELTFEVMDCDGTDALGKAIWKTKPTFSSRLNGVFEPAANGSGTVTVRSNTGFATSGVGYIGTKRVTYTGVSGGTGFTVGTGGANTFAPLGADAGNTYAGPARPPTGGTFDQAAPLRFTDVPATWIGKKVALYIHRIADGVWDTRAQARLEFAGRLIKVTDGAPGIVTLLCRDLRADIESAVLLKKQWHGFVRPGIYLNAGEKFRVQEIEQGATRITSGTFDVVASGAAGSSQINEGLYDLDKLLSSLTTWLASLAASLNADWSMQRRLTDAGYRTVVRAKFGAVTTVGRAIRFGCNRPGPMHFMGFSDAGLFDEYFAISTPYDSIADIAIVSASCPFRVRALQAPHQTSNFNVTLESSEGDWFTNNLFSPPFLQEISDGAALSYVRFGEDHLAVANYSTSTLLTKVTPVAGFGTEYEDEGYSQPGLTYDDAAEGLEVRQIVFLSGAFSALIPRLVASIGGTVGVNHASYDFFPWGAGVPWAVLGDDFVNSCKSLEQAGSSHAISIVLDKPTTLGDILLPEMTLRFAFLVFKDGAYRFVSPPVPNSITANHTLDETNKAIEGGKPPPTRSEWSAENMVNVIKVNHGRDISGEYQGQTITLIDQSSVDAHGETQAVTIDAVNSAHDKSGLYSRVVENLAADLVAFMFPMFGKPLKIVTRTLAPIHYHVTPGDTVSLSDDLVRDPTSGEKGLSGRACIVLSTFHDFGHAQDAAMAGEVTLLLTDEDRTFPLSPAAEVDTAYTSGLYTNGYDSTNFRIALKAHSFSKSTVAVDSTHFDASDLVRIVELDPANSANVAAWSRTVSSVQSAAVPYYLQLTASISAPSWSGSTKKFAVIPQSFASCQASQKLHAFQADDADDMVQDVAEPNLYGSSSDISTFATGNSSDLPSLLADELAGDGKPLTPLQLQTMARMHNNLIHRKTATHRPLIMVAPVAITATTLYQLLYMFPLFIGPVPSTMLRYISIAPMFKSDNAARTATIRVVTSKEPPVGNIAVGQHRWRQSIRSATFTTTATVNTVAAAQDLLPLMSEAGYTWLAIEGKISAAGTATLMGVPTLYLKATS